MFRYLCLACAVVILGDGCRQGSPWMYDSYEAFDQQPGKGGESRRKQATTPRRPDSSIDTCGGTKRECRPGK